MTTQTINQEGSTLATERTESTALVRDAIHRARIAQRIWVGVTLTERLKTIRRIRHAIAESPESLAASVTFRHRNSTGETLAAEIIPIADACKFLEVEAKNILQPKKLGRRLRPKWLNGVDTEIRREPYGLILIIGASNYPLFLSGIQALQALTAGNAVIIKPGVDGLRATAAFRELCVNAGIDGDLIQVLPESVEFARAAINAGVNNADVNNAGINNVGVDKVFLTGSAETGRKVQSALAQSLTPATMELSGCDAVFVLQSADLEKVAKCLVFGLRFNGSATCIAPRRVFVSASQQNELVEEISKVVNAYPAISPCPDDPGWQRAAALVDEAVADGATLAMGDTQEHNGYKSLNGRTVLADARPEMTLLQTDVFAPVISLVPIQSRPVAFDSVDFADETLAADELCPYALGATVFGDPTAAKKLASGINAGCVVINDMIAPTADPRIPFGGRRQSGFGTTRGAAGLLEMTQTKAILHQRAKWLPHLDNPTPFDAPLLAGFLKLSHGRTLGQRMSGLKSLIQAAMAQRKWQRENKSNAGADDAHK